EEPLLVPNNRRFVLFPIQYPEVWKAYKSGQLAFWTAEDIELFDDQEGVRNDSSSAGKEKAVLLHCLAVLSAVESLTKSGERLISRLSNDIQIPEARCFFGFQMMQRNIHQELFTLMLNTFQRDSVQRNYHIEAAREMSTTSKKLAWIEKHLTDSDAPFCTRVFAYAVAHMIFNTSVFTTLLHFVPAVPQDRPQINSPFGPRTPRQPFGTPGGNRAQPKSKLPGLIHAVAKVIVDNARYAEFGHTLVGLCANSVLASEARSIVAEAVLIEVEASKEIFEAGGGVLAFQGRPVNRTTLVARVRAVADELLKEFGVDPLYSSDVARANGSDREDLTWIDDIIVAEGRKGQREVLVVPVQPQTPQQINVRQEFSLDEDF
ncbi:ferritin-like superfamily, partial [Zopfochytrium polystomum]